MNHAPPVASDFYTPMMLKLPPGLNLDDPSISVKFGFAEQSSAGEILIWTRDKLDLFRNGDDLKEGGSRISSGTSYTLRELHYNPSNGRARVLYVAGIQENLAIKKLSGATNHKPQKFIEAIINANGSDISSDKVKYIVTRPDSFFYHLQTRQEVRTGLAASRIYERKDSIDFCQELLGRDKLIELGITDAVVLTDLTTSDPQSGFEAGLYKDYITQKYILSFTGTEGELADIITDGLQGLGLFSTQFVKAGKIGLICWRSELPKVL